MYEKTLLAGWGDMDFNSHMANTAFLAKCGDVRMLFFSEHGFPMSEFLRLKMGPVIQKDEIEYVREVQLLEQVRVTLALAGLATYGSRWMMRNEFFQLDGKLSVAPVPFVDVVNTMLDSTLPLTVSEFEEWGIRARRESTGTSSAPVPMMTSWRCS